MTNKIYPSEIPRKEREIKGVWLQQWRGSVSALLVQEEVEHLISILECLCGRDDVSDDLSEDIDDLQSIILGIMRNGEARMQGLHGILGAYDLHESGRISKPDSEKVECAGYGNLTVV